MIKETNNYILCNNCGVNPCQCPKETEKSLYDLTELIIDYFFHSCKATIKKQDNDWVKIRLEDFISKTIEKAVNEEKEYWMNQPMNEHDNEVRKYEKERIIKIIENFNQEFGWACDLRTVKFVESETKRRITNKIKNNE